MTDLFTRTAAAAALALCLDATGSSAQTGRPTVKDVGAVSPALEHHARATLAEGLWRRPGLSPRDRSLVTVAAVIARGQPVLLGEQLALALHHGVTPAELSETITHLAFYAGWGHAMAAVEPARDLFAARGIGRGQLPPAAPSLLPLDTKMEADRAARVEEAAGPASPGLVRDTASVLFLDLWLRPDLKPRDRSLVTVSALIANGRVEQVPFHLNRALDNGLTRDEASEMVSHLAYYAGWPNAFSAVPVVRGVFEKRSPGQAR